MYNICISIVYVYRFYEAQATLLRRKQVTMFGHTDYCWKRRITGGGADLGGWGWGSKVQIDLQGKHLLDIVSTIRVFIVAVFIQGGVGLKVIEAHKAPPPKRSNQMYKAVVCSCFYAARCGIEPLHSKRTLLLTRSFDTV